MRNPQAPTRPTGPVGVRSRPRHDPAALIAAGKWSPAQKAKIQKVMEEFKAGTLESSSGGRVTNKRQALAIALSEAKSLTAAGRFDERKHKRKRKGERGGGRFDFKGSDRDTIIDAGDALTLADWANPDLVRFAAYPAAKRTVAKAKELGLVSAGTFDESKHPRHEKGNPQGGQFSAKDAVEKADSGGDRLPGDDDFEMDEESQDLENRALKYVEQGYQPTDGEPGEWITLTNSETGEEITLTVGEEYDGEFDEGARGAQEDDGEVDPYATDYDEAGGDAVQNPERADYDSGYQKAAEMLKSGASDEELQTMHEGADTQAFREGFADALARRKGMQASALTASAAGLAPLVPPKAWFDKPTLEGPTPITVTADGQIYGHAALWGTCHTGMPGVCRTPPRSESGYRFFHLGETDTDKGPVHVGRVTMDTGHAPLTASREGTVRHYDDTGTGAAHVRAYEDEHGIVLAGALLPDIPAEKARRLKGATVSGDWRSIGGKLELVGMLAVNVPGFPVPRSMAASLIVEDEPHTMALVAAGVYCDPKDMDGKIKALTARAMGGIDGLVDYAMGGSKQKRRMGVTAAGRPFDLSKHPKRPKGPGGGQWAPKDYTPSEGQIADQIQGEISEARENLEFALQRAERGLVGIEEVRKLYQDWELAILTAAEDVDRLAAAALAAAGRAA